MAWVQGGAKGWFRSMAIPRRWTVRPWSVAPWELPSLVCPAGHGDEVKGRKALEGMKKQGAGASHCNFLTPQKLDCTPKIFGFVVFVFRNVLSAPLVRMRSPVQIWSAAPLESLVSWRIQGFYAISYKRFLHLLNDYYLTSGLMNFYDREKSGGYN